MSEMPREVHLVEQGGIDPITDKPRAGYRLWTGRNGTKYFNEDLVAPLVEALRFYANAYAVRVTYSDYPEHRSYDVFNDDGQRAKEALAQFEKGGV